MTTIDPKRKKVLAAGFFVGAAVALVVIAFFQYAYYHHIWTPNALWLLLVCLNPAGLCGVIFIDIKPTIAEEVILGCVEVTLNGALYALLALGVSTMRGKTSET